MSALRPSFRLRRKARCGKLRFSILGDSVSTYEGINPPDYAVFYRDDNRVLTRILSPEDCWWMQLIRACGGTLGVNGSFSGSTVSGYGFPAACSDRRIEDLCRNGTPDIILVCIGGNDFARGYEIGFINDPDDTPLDEGYFADAFTSMLTKLKARYPKALILCRTLARTTIEGRCEWVYPEMYNGRYPREAYNDAIRTICSIQRVPLLDFAAEGVVYETFDGSHPTWRGHHTYAQAWIRAFSRLFSPVLQDTHLSIPDYDPPVETVLFARLAADTPFVTRQDWLIITESGYMRQIHRTKEGTVCRSYLEDAIIARNFLGSLPPSCTLRETFCGRDTPYGADNCDCWELSIHFASGHVRHIWCRRGQEDICPYPIRKYFASASMLTQFSIPFPWEAE